MATKVYPAFAAACTVDTTAGSDIIALNDINFDTWYEVLGLNYDPTELVQGFPNNHQRPVSQFQHGCLASTAADTLEGGRTFKIVDILDGERIKISKKCGATATVQFYFLKNETIQSAIITPSGGVTYHKPEDANGEVFPFQMIDTATVETVPAIQGSAV